MDKIQQQPNEGEIKKVEGNPAEQTEVKTEQTEVKTRIAEPVKPETKTTENPTVETTEALKTKEVKTSTSVEPAKEMTAEQFELYNETLRRVSKTAKSGLQTRYNAFEDAEVKAAVKAKVLAGEKPDVKSIATSVIERHAPKAKAQTEQPNQATTASNEVVELRAELALIKAGIRHDRLEAAKKLFIAEGADPAKAAEFAEKYPEWKNQAGGGVSFSKAQPVNGKTAPANDAPPVMNDFERKVYAARKARGLPV